MTSHDDVLSKHRRLVKGGLILEAVQNRLRGRKLAMPAILEAVQNHGKCTKLSEETGKGGISTSNGNKRKMAFAFKWS